MDIGYGYDVVNNNDPVLKLLVNAVRSAVEITVERASIPEFFPSC